MAQEQSHSRHHIHRNNTFGQRAADAIANGMGSWPFIIIQSIIVGAWILLNAIGFINHWDAYPFILLNLLFSTQAAYAAPIIMMSQNRQAQKDHIRDDHEAAEVEVLFQINKQQLEILHLLRGHFGVESPLDEAQERDLHKALGRLEKETRDLETELGASAE